MKTTHGTMITFTKTIKSLDKNRQGIFYPIFLDRLSS
jgi:hypothetical protein